MKKKTLNRLKSVLWFLVKLNVLAVPLYLISYFGYSVPEFQNIWAQILSGAMNAFGYTNTVLGHTIGTKVGDSIQQIDFSWDSTGWKSLYAMAALVFASGVGALRYKLKFLAWMLPLVFFVNFLRVFSTVVFSINFGFDYFDLVHGFLWSGLMVVFVIGAWYLLFFKEKVNSR